MPSLVNGLAARFRLDRVRLCFLLAFVAVSLHFFASPRLRVEGDGLYLYAMTRSLVMDGDLAMENEYQVLGDPWRMPLGPEGRRTNWYYIGAPILWIPFFLLAHLCAAIANLFGAGIPLDGYAPIYTHLTTYGSVVFGFLALLVAYRFASRYCRRETAAFGALVFLVCSNLWFYMVHQPSYTHACSAFTAACFLAYWVRGRDRPGYRYFATLGFLFGLNYLVRPQFALYSVIVVFDLARLCLPSLTRREWRPAGRAVLYGVTFALVGIAAMLPQLIVYDYYNGSPFAFSSHAGLDFLRWTEPATAEILFGVRNGLFTWHPIYLVGMVGFLFAFRPGPAVKALLFLNFAVQLIINAAVWDWWGGASFGMRKFLDQSLLIIVGIATLCERTLRFLEERPRLGGRLVVAAAMLPLVLLNIGLQREEVDTPHPTDRIQSMSALYGKAIGRVLADVHDTVGNPISWPASLAFALRHGVSPAKYDGVATSYRYYRDFRSKNGPGVAKISFGRPHNPFLVEGFSEEIQGTRGSRYRHARARSRLLVPLHVVQRTLLTVSASSDAAGGPRGSIRFFVNGERIGEASVGPGWSNVGVVVSQKHWRVGVNSIVLELVPTGPRRGKGPQWEVGKTGVVAPANLSLRAHNGVWGRFIEASIGGRPPTRTREDFRLIVLDPKGHREAASWSLPWREAGRARRGLARFRSRIAMLAVLPAFPRQPVPPDLSGIARRIGANVLPQGRAYAVIGLVGAPPGKARVVWTEKRADVAINIGEAPGEIPAFPIAYRFLRLRPLAPE